MSADPMAALLAAVKNYLHITWNDTETDTRVTEYINAGIAYLDKKRGAPGDYTTPGYCRALLFDYARYARDEALDVFEQNFRPQILAMQNERKVSAYAAAEADAV